MTRAGDDLGEPATHRPKDTEQDSAAGSMGIRLRSGVFQVLFFGHLAITLVVFSPIYFVLPQRACLSIIRGLSKRSLWLLRIVCGTGVEFRGLENLPSGPFILAHKHQSMWEILALGTVIKNPAWVVKSELMLMPLVGWWAKKAGMIVVKRGSRSKALARLTEGCRKALDADRTVILAPEGTRKRPGDRPNYKYGIAHLSQEFDVPIVPAALNSGLYWPWWGFLRYPGTVVVSFLPAIEESSSADAFLASLEEAIETETDRLLLEARDGRG